MRSVEEINRFWLEETGPKGWYEQSDALDTKITDMFRDTWEEAREGACGLWLTDRHGAMAYLILTDQFPRNMFRGQGKAFATDGNARAAAKVAIDRKWDLQWEEPARQFFYLPLMHSESLVDQDRCVRLVRDRMPETGNSTLLHARAHRRVIRAHGRFPFRNEALGRDDTAAEKAFMAEGAYGAIVRELQAE
ncbi:DUF924 family protein [Yoonia sp. 208BN28-4]|uniref:DUF924 family protein n=1 Tax=Yoonia sp. 208BN28-4 TaxID=3126505 RepID=UPI0030B5C9D5